jgi:diguanylate cyclase
MRDDQQKSIVRVMGHDTLTDLVLTEPLTGFGSRAKLLDDLETAVKPDSPSSVLVIIGFDGLTEYRDTFGRLETQTLLAELAGRLQDELKSVGTCYRPREDEFALIVHAAIDTVQPLLDVLIPRLHEPGRFVSVTAAYGFAMLPDEAPDPLEAMMIADQELNLAVLGRRSRERRLNPR